MELIEDQNPLRSQLEKDLNESAWMQKFKALSELLQRLKIELPITEQCILRWDTSQDSLLIHCPNLAIRTHLIAQSDQIEALASPAKQVILKLPEYPDVLLVH